MNEQNIKSLQNQKTFIEHFYKEIYLQQGFGPRQNAYYMQEIFKRLDKRVIDFLEQEGKTVLDSGCAMGYGTILFEQRFPAVRVSGLEVCETAVQKGKALFPEINFIYNEVGLIGECYDVIISSHCLEHYPDPGDLLRDLLKRSKSYCIILVPYQESPLGPSHLSSLSDDVFPETINLYPDRFSRISCVIFDGDRNFSRSKNILVIYAKNQTGFF